MSSEDGTLKNLRSAFTHRFRPSLAPSMYILFALSSLRTAIEATGTSWKDACSALCSDILFDNKDRMTAKALQCAQRVMVKLVHEHPKPDYQPEGQLTTCTFTKRSVPNLHFISVDFTVDSLETDIQDKRNKETKYKKEVDMHYKRLFCKMARWLAEKYLPLNLGTVIATSVVTFQQQKPRESNMEYFETMLNMLNLQNDLADVAFGDLFNFYPLNAFSPTHNSDTANHPDAMTLPISVAKMPEHDFILHFAQRINDPDLSSDIARRGLKTIDELRDLLKLDREHDKGRRQQQRKISAKRPHGDVHVRTVHVHKKQRFERKQRPPRAAPDGCPDGTCFQYFKTGKCGYQARTGKACKYKHDTTIATNAVVKPSQNEYENALRIKERYEADKADKPYSCLVFNETCLDVAGKSAFTMNAVENFDAYMDTNVNTFIDLHNAYAYATFAFLVKLCFIFVVIVECQPKFKDILHAKAQNVNQNLSIAPFALDVFRNMLEACSALIWTSICTFGTMCTMLYMQHIGITHNMSHLLPKLRKMLPSTSKRLCVLSLCCLMAATTVYICTIDSDNCNVIMADNLVLASKQWNSATVADNVMLLRAGLRNETGSDSIEMVSLLIDTGSAATLTCMAALERYVKDKPCCVRAFTKFATPRQFRVADQSGMDALGAVTIRIHFSPIVFKDIDFLVVDKLSCNFIISKGEFRSWKPLVDLGDEQTVRLRGFNKILDCKLFDDFLPHE